jgi:hypothetical protein
MFGATPIDQIPPRRPLDEPGQAERVGVIGHGMVEIVQDRVFNPVLHHFAMKAGTDAEDAVGAPREQSGSQQLARRRIAGE